MIFNVSSSITRLSSFAVMMLSVYFSTGQELPPKAEVISTVRLVNDYWLSVNQDPGDREWARSVYFTANIDLYKAYPYEAYLDYALSWAEKHNWALSGGTTTTNADRQCAGQAYLELYNLDDLKPDYKKASIQANLTNMIQIEDSTAWWWIDAMYMAMPSFTKLGVFLGDTSYFNHMYKLYTDTKVTRGLYNETDGLWYRDETFLPPYTTPNDSNSYWARGNGWVFAAHVRVLQILPDTDPHYAEYLGTFQNMAEGLRQRQRPDGFWNVSLDDPDDYGGPEVSGTAFFTYGMAWGVNNGFLDSATYYPVIQKAWEGMTSTAVHEDGFLGYIQGVGVGPSSSQPVTYETTADFGVGAFLLAGSEVVNLAGGPVPEPPVFWLEDVTLLDEEHIQVDFNRPLNFQKASNTANYSIDGGIEVLGVTLDPADSSSCILAISEVSYGKYFLTVEDLTSASGDTIDGAGKSFSFSGLSITGYSGYEPNSTNIPENTLDIDLSTRWSEFGTDQWVTYDLGVMKTLDSVGIAFFRGNERSTYITLQVSTDGQNFDNVFDGGSNGITLDLETFNTGGHVARYLKFIGHGNSLNEWNSVTELRAHTSSMTPPTAILLSGNEVDELDSIDTEIGVLSSEDSDVGDAHQYSLDTVGDNKWFAIDGDRLLANAVFDFESQSTYSIQVTSEDLAGLTYTQTLEIHVNDVDEDQAQELLSVGDEQANILVYPVPVSGERLYVQIESGDSFAFQLLDVQGRLVNFGTSSGGIDLQNLRKGVYFLSIVSDDGMAYQRTIIKK